MESTSNVSVPQEFIQKCCLAKEIQELKNVISLKCSEINTLQREKEQIFKEYQTLLSKVSI